MKIFIGISFVILSFAILVFVIVLFGYIVHISKKEFDATPIDSSNSKNTEGKA